MPGLVIPPGFISAAFRFSLTGDPEEMLTTIAFSVNDSSDPTTLANLLMNGWTDNFDDSLLNSSYEMVGVTVTVGVDGGSIVAQSTNPAVAGSEASGVLPQNNAMLIRKNTALPGRQGKGRCYLPAGYLFESEVSNAGVVSSGSRGNINAAFAAALVDWLAIATIDDVVLLHSDATEPTVLLTGGEFSAQPVIATQRHRLRK